MTIEVVVYEQGGPGTAPSAARRVLSIAAVRRTSPNKEEQPCDCVMA